MLFLPKFVFILSSDTQLVRSAGSPVRKWEPEREEREPRRSLSFSFGEDVRRRGPHAERGCGSWFRAF